MPAMRQEDGRERAASARPGRAGYGAEQEATIRLQHRAAQLAQLAGVVSDPLLRLQLRALARRCRRALGGTPRG